MTSYVKFKKPGKFPQVGKVLQVYINSDVVVYDLQLNNKGDSELVNAAYVVAASDKREYDLSRKGLLCEITKI